MEQNQLQIHPCALLRDIEARNRQHAVALPQQTAVRHIWTSLGFLLGNRKLATLLTQVREVFPCPLVTRVPGAKPWVIGITNVRGNILPLMDLHAYIYGTTSCQPQNHRSRILVIGGKKALAGLLVDEVFGIKHFLKEELIGHDTRSDDPLHCYIQRGFVQQNESWLEFDFNMLMEKESFLQTASQS